jgi:hypothetical protein
MEAAEEVPTTLSKISWLKEGKAVLHSAYANMAAMVARLRWTPRMGFPHGFARETFFCAKKETFFKIFYPGPMGDPVCQGRCLWWLVRGKETAPNAPRFLVISGPAKRPYLSSAMPKLAREGYK